LFELDSLPTQVPSGGGRFEFDRMRGLATRSPETSARVGHLYELAQRGLQDMSVGTGMVVQTMRRLESDARPVLRPEGDNLRYTAIVALGLSRLGEDAQRQVLRGLTAADLAMTSVARAPSSADTGAVALAAWAAAEAGETCASELFEMLTVMLAPDRAVETVSCAWALTAALAARRLGDTDALIALTADRLLAGQATTGLFPHLMPSAARGWGRAHVGCFADQIYPVQASARLFAVGGDEHALAAAEACAIRLCALQGEAGQWWWHYDIRDGSVVEGYPVYSVHQHAMAPMALLDLWEASGDDRWWQNVIRGFRWIDRHPETSASLVSEPYGLIWRKIGRRETGKAARTISAFTTGVKRGWHLPALDVVFPPDRVDHECRPYELGWLVYAWRSAGVVEALHGTKGDSDD